MARRQTGEGSIFKRKDGGKNSKWAASVFIGYDPKTGKPKRKTFYGPTRATVAEKLAEVLPKLKNGGWHEPSKQLFADWLDTWLNDYMKPSLRPTTWESYFYLANKHIAPALGHLRIKQLQTAHLQKLYNDKLEGGREDGKGGGLSPRTVRYIHVVIRGALEQAKKEGAILINPADSVKLPREQKKEIRFFDAEEMARFLNAARETRWFPAYLLELATGLRRGELLALRWKDVDLEKGSVTVNQNLVRVKGGLKFQEPKTKLANRTISIPTGVATELRAYKKRQAEEKLNAGMAWQKELTFLREKPEKNDLVFSNELGGPCCPRGITQHFERLIEKYNMKVEEKGKRERWKQEAIDAAKLPRITFHGLRHTFATMSLQEGVDMKTTQENLGHFDPAFTLSVYSGVTKRMKQEATDKIGNLLASCLDNK
ncbi:MAG: site-specific integrase [Bacillota bacterium]|nr:site-specific integrase [Bacillota bacterium]